MATKNIVSYAIPATDKTTIQTSINTIASKLPFLISLTNEERKGGIKLGDKTGVFMQKSLDYAKNNPTLVPPFTDLNEIAKDLALYNDLTNILEWLKPLVQKIEDTQMEAGTEAFSAILPFYDTARVATQKDVPGAKAIYTDLQSRFPGHKKKKGPKPTPIIPPIK